MLGVNMVYENDDGFLVVGDYAGFWKTPDELLEIAGELIRTARLHADEIEEHNFEQEDYLDNLMTTSHHKPKSTPQPRHVYMLECGGRYKIGMSKDVERRIGELDKRPFEIRLVAQSELTENAHQIEQRIHQRAEPYRISGEWYGFSEPQAERLAEYINSVK